MDLNSLPDELVAGIFKYNSYQTVLQVRKLDSRIDSIAKTYDLGTRVPVNDVTLGHYVTVKWKNRKGKRKLRKRIINGEVSLKFDEDIWNYYNFPDYETLGWIVCNFCGTDSLQQMESMLETVQIQKGLYYYVKGVAMTDSDLDALIKQKRCFRKTTKVTFGAPENEIVVSKQKMRHFLASCKRVNNLHCVATGGVEAFCNSTICLKEEDFFTKQQWTLPALSLGKSTIAKVHERLKNIEGITHSFSRDDNNSLLECRCRVKGKRNVEIQFLIEGRNLNRWWHGEEGGVGINDALFDDHDDIDADDSDDSDDD